LGSQWQQLDVLWRFLATVLIFAWPAWQIEFRLNAVHAALGRFLFLPSNGHANAIVLSSIQRVMLILRLPRMIKFATYSFSYRL
jgi:hypothetical protein